MIAETPSPLRRLFGDFVRFVFPSACRVCGAPLGETRTLCAVCWDRIALWHGNRCERCGAPSSELANGCAACPEAFAESGVACRTRAAVHYTAEVRALIHALKYESRPSLAKPLADFILALEPAAYRWSDYAALVPVPLHRTRLAERGFNQAELISRHLGAATGLPVRTRWARRIRPTRQLSLLDEPSQRRREVADAFIARIPAESNGSSILVVDDVMTTGSTAAELVGALQNAGAGSVDILAVARSVRLDFVRAT